MPRRSDLVVVVSLLALLLVPLAAAAEDKPEKQEDQIKVWIDRMKDAGESERLKLIDWLVKTKNIHDPEEAGKAVSKYMSKGTTAVKVAAIKAVGEFKYKKSFGKLMSMIKLFKKEPQLLAAVAEAIGAFGDPRAMEDLVDIAKKWMPKDHTVCSAAARGLGKIPSKKAVDELIKLLDLSYPKAASGDGAPPISQETIALYAKSRPAIIAGLQELTGWDFNHAFAWNHFWEKKSKSWKPGAQVVDLTKLDKWEDPGYGFVIKKPKGWMFERDPAGRNRIHVALRDEKSLLSLFYMEVYESNNTPAGEAQRILDYYLGGGWKDIKTDKMVRKELTFQGQSAYLLQFTGRSGTGSILRQKEIYFRHDVMIYALRGFVSSGAEQVVKTVDDDLDSIFDSFRLTF